MRITRFKDDPKVVEGIVSFSFTRIKKTIVMSHTIAPSKLAEPSAAIRVFRQAADGDSDMDAASNFRCSLIRDCPGA